MLAFDIIIFKNFNYHYLRQIQLWIFQPIQINKVYYEVLLINYKVRVTLSQFTNNLLSEYLTVTKKFKREEIIFNSNIIADEGLEEIFKGV